MQKQKTMKKIILINPNYQYKIKSVAQSTVAPPLGLSYIAAVLLREGFRVSIIDANAENLSFESIIKRVVAFKPDIAGLTAVTPTITDVVYLCTQIKIHNKGIITVVGGVHVTMTAEQTLKENRDIDFIIRGEGEYSFLQFLKSTNHDYNMIHGLAYRDHSTGDIIVNNYDFIKNLDDLPLPAREILPMKKYRTFESSRFTTMLAMRGCPASCIYCSVGNMFGKDIRYRNADSVIQEMMHCYDTYRINYISFLDDTFTFHKDWVKSFCAKMTRSGLNKKIRWNCLTRVNTVSEDLLLMMKAAGCSRIELGIESGSEQILETLKKNIKISDIYNAFRAAKRAGLSTMGFVILNSPGDDINTLEKTKKLVFEIDPDYLQVSFATPYPGTELFNITRSRNLITTEDWAKYIFLNNIILKNNSLSEQQLRDFCLSLNRAFYFRLKYIFKLCKMIIRDKLSVKRIFLASVNGINKIIKQGNS